MPKYLKGKVYKTMIIPVLMYGAEAWTVTGREEGLLENRNENAVVDTWSLTEGYEKE